MPYPVYKKFQDVYGQPTTAKDRPSKQSEQQTSEADLKRKAHLVAGKVLRTFFFIYMNYIAFLRVVHTCSTTGKSNANVQIQLY